MQQTVTIGSKRQFTLPKTMADSMGLDEGSQLLVEMRPDCIVLHPAVSLKRADLPEELLAKYEARRGAKPTDIPLAEFLKEIGYTPRRRGTRRTGAQGVSSEGQAAIGAEE